MVFFSCYKFHSNKIHLVQKPNEDEFDRCLTKVYTYSVNVKEMFGLSENLTGEMYLQLL